MVNIPREQQLQLPALLRRFPQNTKEGRELRSVMVALRHAARDVDLQQVAALSYKLEVMARRMSND